MLKTKFTSLRHKVTRILDKYLSGNSMNFRQVMIIILPLLVDQAFIVILSFLNTAMISSSGADAVAAVNMIDSINIFLLNVFIAVSTGGTVIVAQYKGAGNDTAVCKAAAQSVTMVSIISLIIAGFVIFLHNPVIAVLFGKAEPSVISSARIYLIGSCVVYPFFAIFEAVCGALRGIGETKSSLFLTVIMNGSYVLLNILFINILHFGIWGLVFSLIISRTIGMVSSLVFIMKFHKTLSFHFYDMVHIDFPLIRKILFIGIPFAAEQMFFNGGKLLTQTFIVQLGTNALFVNAVGNSIAGLFQIGPAACYLSIVTVVGQSVGRHDIPDARKFIRSFILLSGISFILTELLILPFIDPLILFFSPPAEVIPDIHTILIIIAVANPLFWAFSFITPSALRAAGDSRFTSLVSLITMWLIRVILGYVLSIVLPFGIAGVWFAMVTEWIIRAVVFHLRLHGKQWYKHKLVE